MYGEKIKQLRKQANLSQADLANMVGISRPNISFWENAEFPPLDAIDKVCKAFNIEIWRFFISNVDLAKVIDMPEGFINLMERINALDDQSQDDLLDIFSVNLEKYEKRDALANQRVMIPSRKTVSALHDKYYIHPVDEFYAPSFARNVIDIALNGYFRQLPWIEH